MNTVSFRESFQDPKYLNFAANFEKWRFFIIPYPQGIVSGLKNSKNGDFPKIPYTQGIASGPKIFEF